jgi:amino acid transporter
MLLVAFATIFSGASQAFWSLWAEAVLALAGIGLAWVQYHLTRSVMAKTKYLDRKYLSPLDPIYREFMKLPPRGRSAVQRLWLPCGLIAIWVSLLAAVLGVGLLN